jgi:hypothetical protein
MDEKSDIDRIIEFNESLLKEKCENIEKFKYSIECDKNPNYVENNTLIKSDDIPIEKSDDIYELDSFFKES